jgi:hydroxyacylglutathione hydrolase
MTVRIHPIAAPWKQFQLFSFLIEAPELAIVDTGVTESAMGVPAALESLGLRVADIKWILLTHGHVDHCGGAYALWKMTGGQAKIVVHEADADWVRRRSRHLEQYQAARAKYVPAEHGDAEMVTFLEEAISGEIEPHLLVRDGDRLSLGGDVSLTVQSLPGHSDGSVAYVVDGQRDVFVGDAVQIHGAANGFPGYVDPDAYRASLVHLRDTIRPRHLYLGHPYRNKDGVPYGVRLDADQGREAIQQSLDLEKRIREAYLAGQAEGRIIASESVYSPFHAVANEVGYERDPRPEPSPFFITTHGYLTHLGPS